MAHLMAESQQSQSVFLGIVVVKRANRAPLDGILCDGATLAEKGIVLDGHWSKGLKERSVIVGHALKNGLIPVITLKGMTLAAIVGGSVLVETVFSIPGMGRYAVQGLFAKDYTIVQACLLISSTVVLAANLLVDLSYGWLDPRIRYG